MITLYSEIPNGKVRIAKKIAKRICKAKGYNENSTDALNLVILNLSRWKEKLITNQLHHHRFWQAVNKFEKLVLGHCI